MKDKLKNLDFKYYIKISVILLVISSVVATMLAVVNHFTKDRIAENEFAVMEETIEKLFSECESIKTVEKEFKDNVSAVYEIYNSDEKIGYCVKVEPIGFKEKITVIVGADTDGKCVGVEIISISDTPGVGTKVKDSAYLKGYIGLDADGSAKYDTISGATISSAAVRSGVEAALALDIFGENENVVGDNNKENPNSADEQTTENSQTPATDQTGGTSNPEDTQSPNENKETNA